MALTTQQISDLDNSMVAAQDAALGTLVSAMQTNQIRSGCFTPAEPTTPVVTGLSSITGVSVSIAGSPKTKHLWTTATTGSVAGVIWVKCWMPTNASTVNPVLSTGSAADAFALVSWIASGSTV